MSTAAEVQMRVGDILISLPGTTSPVTPMRILGIEKARDRLLVIATPRMALQGAIAPGADASEEKDGEKDGKPDLAVQKRARTSYVAKPREESYRLIDERIGKDLIAIPSPRVAILTDDDMRALVQRHVNNET